MESDFWKMHRALATLVSLFLPIDRGLYARLGWIHFSGPLVLVSWNFFWFFFSKIRACGVKYPLGAHSWSRRVLISLKKRAGFTPSLPKLASKPRWRGDLHTLMSLNTRARWSWGNVLWLYVGGWDTKVRGAKTARGQKPHSRVKSRILKTVQFGVKKSTVRNINGEANDFRCIFGWFRPPTRMKYRMSVNWLTVPKVCN